jgi:hypothetical protein
VQVLLGMVMIPTWAGGIDMMTIKTNVSLSGDKRNCDC